MPGGVASSQFQEDSVLVPSGRLGWGPRQGGKGRGPPLDQADGSQPLPEPEPWPLDRPALGQGQVGEGLGSAPMCPPRVPHLFPVSCQVFLEVRPTSTLAGGGQEAVYSRPPQEGQLAAGVSGKELTPQPQGAPWRPSTWPCRWRGSALWVLSGAEPRLPSPACTHRQRDRT